MAKFIPKKKRKSFFGSANKSSPYLSSSASSSNLPSSDSASSISSSKTSSPHSKPSFWSKFSFLKWVDPFTYVDLLVMPRVKRVTQSSAVEFLVNAFFALIFAWIIYSVLGVAFGTSSPLVIVYSASMEPTFFRGDVMALSNPSEGSGFGAEVFLDRNISSVPVSDFASPIYSGVGLSSIYFKDANVLITPNKLGSVIVYDSYPAHLPIIHRSIVKISALDGNFVLTKGDNVLTNFTFDQDCGNILGTQSQKPCISFFAVPINHIQGRAFFTIPKLGCVKLWLFDDLFSLISSGSLPKDFKGVC